MFGQRNWSRGTALGVFVLLATVVWANATADARKAIQAIYDSHNAAVARKDLDGALAHRTQDYVSIGAKGDRKSLEQSRQVLRRLFAAMEWAQGSSVIQKITLKDDTAIVLVKEKGRLVLANPQTGQKATLDINGLSRDVWVRRQGRWLVKQSQNLQSKITRNGQPVSPPTGKEP